MNNAENNAQFADFFRIAESKSLPKYLFIFIIVAIFLPLISGCSGDGGSSLSSSDAIIPSFESQKYTGQQNFEDCHVKVYLETEQGLIDISPDRVPLDATYVNNNTLLLDPNLEGRNDDEKDEPQINDKDWPQWEMYQKMLFAGDVSCYANLYSSEADEDGFLRRPAYAPYSLDEDIPDGAERYLHVFSRYPMTFANPCTTTIEYTSQTPWGRINNVTYQYRSWSEEDADGNIQNLYEFSCMYNGEEMWRTGPQFGWIYDWIPHVGFGYPSTPGIFIHTIKKDGNVVFERSYLQRKLTFEKFAQIEFTIGDEVQFNNAMLWNTDYQSPDTGVAPTSEENPRWNITIKDPDGNVIVSEQIPGVQLAWSWDSSGYSYGAATTSTFPLRKYKGKKAIMVPEWSRDFKYNPELLNQDSQQEDEIIFTFSALASAVSYKPEDTLPPWLATYHCLKASNISGFLPPRIDVRKIFIDGDVKLLDEENREIKASKNNPQYAEDDKGNVVRSESSALIINSNKDSKATITYFPRKVPIPSRYIVFCEATLNDLALSLPPTNFRLVFSMNPVEFTSSDQERVIDYSEKNGTFRIPPSVQKIDSVKWYSHRIRDDGTIDKRRLIEETNSKVFALLNKPQDPQKKPRADVLDIACEIAEGEKHDEYIKMIMVRNLFYWLDNRAGNKLFTYNGDSFHFDYDKMTFDLKKFLADKEGNCEDVSSLYQVCANSLGINMGLNKLTSLEALPFKTYPVMIPGYSTYKSEGFRMHQVATQGNYIYDALLRFEIPPHFANGILDKFTYPAHLIMSGRAEWRFTDFAVKHVK